MKKWEVLDKKIVYEHPWEQVFIEKIKTPKGLTFDYLLSKPNDFVIIVPFLTNDKVLMITQYKHGALKELLGFPAGFINQNEKPLDAAKRELYEETGYTTDSWEEIAVLSENPTKRRNVFSIFFAKNLKRDISHTENLDDGEGEIQVEEVSVDNLLTDSVLPRIQAAPMLSTIPFIQKYRKLSNIK